VIRLRLPHSIGADDASSQQSPLPPELRWDAPRPSLTFLLGRREFLKAAAVTLGALAVPLRGARRAVALARGRFLTPVEYETLEALCDRIIPPDDAPGAKDLGAARYIDRMLTAFDFGGVPRIFAGGPYSNRNPLPDNDDGTPSVRRPRNAFLHFIPLTRLQDVFWRGEIFGSATVPELAAVDAQYGGPKKGLRDLYRDSLVKVDEVSLAAKGAPFRMLSPSDQDAVFRMLDAGAFAPDPRREQRTFIDVLIEHTLQGCFATPEYGGNRRRSGRPQGWEMIGLEGDNQPLGFSIYSERAEDYVERADHPMSTPNPDEIGPGGVLMPHPLTADGQQIQNNIVLASSIFSSGSC
jgi:gluconate 2-dehydrogenase gamma chain